MKWWGIALAESCSLPSRLGLDEVAPWNGAHRATWNSLAAVSYLRYFGGL